MGRGFGDVFSSQNNHCFLRQKETIVERQKSLVDTTYIHSIGNGARKVTGHLIGFSENVSRPLQYSSPNAHSDSKQKETEPCQMRSTPQDNCSVGLSSVKVIKLKVVMRMSEDERN